MLTSDSFPVKGVTLYCDLDADADWDDSIMWLQNATDAQRIECLNKRNCEGNGTLDNPFKNGSYALSVINRLYRSKSMYGYNQVPQCWPWIRLVCTGTAHYCLIPWAYPADQNGVCPVFYPLIIQGANIQVQIITEQRTHNIWGIYFDRERSCCIDCTVDLTVNAADGRYTTVCGIQAAYASGCTVTMNVSGIGDVYGVHGLDTYTGCVRSSSVHLDIAPQQDSDVQVQCIDTSRVYDCEVQATLSWSQDKEADVYGINAKYVQASDVRMSCAPSLARNVVATGIRNEESCVDCGVTTQGISCTGISRAEYVVDCNVDITDVMYDDSSGVLDVTYLLNT